MAFRLMRNFAFVAALLMTWSVGCAQAVSAAELITLCYHDIRDDVDGNVDADTTAVDSKQLAAQFSGCGRIIIILYPLMNWKTRAVDVSRCRRVLYCFLLMMVMKVFIHAFFHY
ncbi:MAG: hypothetical protein IPN27_06210 [Cellvibrionales bacterium]|nr:hypothetical protein [Cellvibrionales bacterium]